MTRDEEGVTLVELLVAIVVLSAIIAAIATALVVAFRNMDSTQTRLEESHDAQMASAFVVTDVQSAATITTAQPTCGATSATVATFSWSDQGIANVVTYILETAGGERRLRRNHSAGSTSSEVVVAHELTGTCSDTTADDPAVEVTESCAGSTTCPTSVRLTLTDATGYQFSLTGERRAR